MKESYFGSHKGFTLAEVLVTLGIIGVVSAMTVPTLMQNYQRQSYVTQLHKVYNEFSQAGENCKFLVLISPINSLKDEFNNVAKGNMVKLPKIVKFVLKKIPFIFNSLENILNLKQTIKKNNAPTYMIYSIKDSVVPPTSTENLSKQINNLRGIVKLKEGGHSIDDGKLDAFSNLPL